MSAPASGAYAIDPFGPAANPTAYVPFASSERARATVERSLDDGRVAALVGPPGLGKTVILQLVRARRAERSAVAYVPFCNLEPDELFTLALDALGEHPEDVSPRDTLLALARGCADRGGILLLVDDAAAMPTASAEALAELLLVAGGGLGLVLAAVEGPEARRVCGAFGTRVDVVRLSEGLSESETRRYLEARLAWAGARPDLVAAFDDDTVAELHRESGGVPRRVNQRAHDLVRRVAPAALPRLAEALGQLVRTPAPESPIAEAPLVLPSTEPPPRALLERDAYRETGGYRMVRGRPVEAEPEPPPSLPASRAEERSAAEAAAPAPHSAETPADVFARLKRPPPEDGARAPTPETATAAPPAPAARAPVSASGPRRSVLFAGAALFAFIGALAFAWASGRLAPLPLPGSVAPEAAGVAEVEPPAASIPPATPPADPLVGSPATADGEAVAQPPGPVPAPTPERTARAVVPAEPEAGLTAAEPAGATPEASDAAAASESESGPAPPRPSSAIASATPRAEPAPAPVPEAAPEAEPQPVPTRAEPPTGATAAVPVAEAPAPGPPRETVPPTPPAQEPAAEPPIVAAEQPTLAAEPPTLAAEQPTVAAEPVTVAINAIPWAVVSVDGRDLGETPLAGIRLAPGPHTFRARMPDGTTREQTVDIAPDRRTVVFD